MSTISYHVPEMHCQACETSIRKSLEQVPGIQSVDVDLNTRRVSVEYDPSGADPLSIKSRIEKAGFDVG